ncbi:GNAT family N-acetyltransferase [Desulfoscipio geothermicus]|uniref:Acetoin utilization protein AcuA n=1 Tax=Desulfoscipio geothermicus DSM 3669 TaxID=1121426 RepID=A0A1I6DJM1_9FIRM|nr:GNAT family N-acetyltransferase [Desulfoscipio geothermicus]SFR05542.1 acetoin utilization protein AcuA [Desulfoscipio geothermicus DSM 3669]
MSKDISSESIATTRNNEKPLNAGEIIITPKGKMIIEGPVTGDRLNTMHICIQMNTFRRSNAQLKALAKIAYLPQGRVYVARWNNMIVGYVTFHLPDVCSRWRCHPRVIEMGGIEVAKEWRSCHIGNALLKYIFRDDFWEDYIVIGFECFRYWDLQGNNLTLWKYRNMIDKFVGKVNFMPMFTTMYDVLEHPANALIVRCGTHVSLEDWALFKKISTRLANN